MAEGTGLPPGAAGIPSLLWRRARPHRWLPVERTVHHALPDVCRLPAAVASRPKRMSVTPPPPALASPPLASPALEAGKHVLVEKPLAGHVRRGSAARRGGRSARPDADARTSFGRGAAAGRGVGRSPVTSFGPLERAVPPGGPFRDGSDYSALGPRRVRTPPVTTRIRFAFGVRLAGHSDPAGVRSDYHHPYLSRLPG